MKIEIKLSESAHDIFIQYCKNIESTPSKAINHHASEYIQNLKIDIEKGAEKGQK